MNKIARAVEGLAMRPTERFAVTARAMVTSAAATAAEAEMWNDFFLNLLYYNKLEIYELYHNNLFAERGGAT